MRCEQFEQRLQRCLDRRERPSDDPAIRRHAGVCPRCRGTLAAYDRLADGLDLLELPVPDETFSQRVVRQVRVDRRSPAVGRRLAGAILAIAACLLLAWLPQFAGRDDTVSSASPRVAATGTAPAVVARMTSVSHGVPSGPSAAASTGMTADAKIGLIPWTIWPTSLSFGAWNPIDTLAGGLTPITSPLGVAVEEIRRTIPLGRVEPPSASRGDSVRRSASRHASPLA